MQSTEAKEEAALKKSIAEAAKRRASVCRRKERNARYICHKNRFADLCGIDKRYFDEKPGGRIAKCIAFWLTVCWKLKLVKADSSLTLPKAYLAMEAKLLRWCKKHDVPNKGKNSFY